MAVIETWLRQDLKGLVTVRSLQGQVFSLDNGGNLIGVKVTKDYKPVTLTGTVTGYCILSDGQTVTVTGSGNAGIQNGNEAYIVLPQLVYSVPGQISIVIKLTSGDTTTTLAACTGYVYRSRTSNEVVPPGTPIPDLSTMEEVIRRATAATDAANAATVGAEKVDASMTKEGDIITISVTDRDGNVTEKTVTDQTEAMKHKADINGVYPELTSGTAEQLASTQYVENAEAYKLRPTGGSADVGNREYLEKIVGGTVCWNQLYPAHTSASKTVPGLTITFEDGWMNVSGTAEETTSLIPKPLTPLVPAGHFAFIVAEKKGISPRWGRNGYSQYIERDCHIRRDNSQAFTGSVLVYFDQGVTYNGSIRFATYDITAMFGQEIAEHIYNLEIATTGAGLAWFRKYFPNNYYEYNPGEMINVSGLRSHDTVGFNAWDEEWELGSINTSTGANQGATNTIRSINKAKVIPNTRYSITKSATGYVYIFFYDEDENPVQYVKQDGDTTVANNITARAAEAQTQRIFTVPSGATRIRIRIDNTTAYNHDVCINLAHSGTRNGEYEPYEKHSYPLDSSVTLRGVPKLDANGNLYFDGDEYTSDGVVAKKYGAVNLGTLTWTKTNWFQASAVIPDASASANNDKRFFTNVDCTINSFAGSVSSTVSFLGVSESGSIRFSFGGLYNDMTVEQFAEAMSNKYLVYPLATQATEQAELYPEIQVCSDWGTEEFISDSILPVGHLTRYPANLRDKLQNLPSLADTDGDYIVRQTGSQMSLVRFGDTEEITGLKGAFEQLNDNVIAESAGPAPIISVTDGADGMPMRKVEVAIEPVQDLHGYEYPWPAGGGKNLLPGTPVNATTKGCTFTYDNGLVTLNGTASSAGGRTTFKTANFSLKAGTYTFKPFNISGTADQVYLQNGTEIIWGISSGPTTRTFTLESDYDALNIGINVKEGTSYNYSALLGIFTDSEVTEWTPYSNVCPISGWTGAKVTRTGKNLFDYAKIKEKDTYYTVEGTTITKNDDTPLYVDLFNGTTGSGAVANNKGFLKAGTYTVSAIIEGSSTLRIYSLNNDNTSTGVILATINAQNQIATFTIDSDEYYTLRYGSKSGLIITNLQIEPGSTATAYESYQGQTYEVAFPDDPGTVYGGTLDVSSGKLVVDRATVVLDGTTESWSTFTSAETGNDFRFRTNGLVGAAFGQGINGTQKADWLATTTGYTTSGASPIIRSIRQSLTLLGNQNRLYVYVPDIVSNESDIDGWKAYLAQHPLTVSYLLATPQEITLTTTEVKTLLGINNVWSDVGNTSITYPADTKMYIDNRINSTRKLIAGIETVFVASKAYAVGDMLIIGDDLYKVASSIASGATITVGTNVIKTTVAEQLLALMNA